MPNTARCLPFTLALAATALLGACASSPEPVGPPRPETVVAVTDAAELIKFNAGQPQRVLSRQALRGLAAGDKLVGIDYRVSRGVLYALSASGRLYTLDTGSGQLSPVGTAGPVAQVSSAASAAATIGLNFNPVADRIRVISDTGLNLRLHPETGALAAADPAPHYGERDASQGQKPQLVAAAYTYNKANDKLTTNYAIDRAAGTLVMQGSKEGALPAVSPNTGQLFTVGPLGTGRVEAAAFDISDVSNSPLAALRIAGRTQLYLLDLATGKANPLGTVGDGRPVWGIAIEP